MYQLHFTHLHASAPEGDHEGDQGNSNMQIHFCNFWRLWDTSSISSGGAGRGGRK